MKETATLIVAVSFFPISYSKLKIDKKLKQFDTILCNNVYYSILSANGNKNQLNSSD